MTATNHLHVVAAATVGALALISGNAGAAVTPAVQAAASESALESVDARKGRVLFTVLHDASERPDGAPFYAGRFIFNQ